MTCKEFHITGNEDPTEIRSIFFFFEVYVPVSDNRIPENLNILFGYNDKYRLSEFGICGVQLSLSFFFLCR